MHGGQPRTNNGIFSFSGGLVFAFMNPLVWVCAVFARLHDYAIVSSMQESNGSNVGAFVYDSCGPDVLLGS